MNDEVTARFRLHPETTRLTLEGTDNHGHPFVVTIDRVWAANLHVEIGDWLGGGND